MKKEYMVSDVIRFATELGCRVEITKPGAVGVFMPLEVLEWIAAEFRKKKTKAGKK